MTRTTISSSRGEVIAPKRKGLFVSFFCMAILAWGSVAMAASNTQPKTPNLVTRSRVQVTIPDTSEVQRIIMRDGTIFQGQTLVIHKDEIEFQTRFGSLTISIDDIERLQQIPKSQLHHGQFWFTNPNATRLFFGPTARTLKKGEGYFADHFIFFPAVTFGLTDRITLGGGMSIFPGVGLGEQILFMTPKVGLVSEESLNLAVGVLLANVSDEGSAGILYSVGTFGSIDNSFTIGVGHGFQDGDWANHPMIMAGFEKRLSRGTAFVSENWFFPGVSQPLISYGIRKFGERMSVDIGLINTIGDGTFFPGIPYFDVVVQF